MNEEFGACHFYIFLILSSFDRMNVNVVIKLSMLPLYAGSVLASKLKFLTKVILRKPSGQRLLRTAVCEIIVKSKSKSHYNRQSVGQSVLVSDAHLGPATNFSSSLRFSLDSFWLFCSTLSDERTGL
jgi:hypothetical protein